MFLLRPPHLKTTTLAAHEGGEFHGHKVKQADNRDGEDNGLASSLIATISASAFAEGSAICISPGLFRPIFPPSHASTPHQMAEPTMVRILNFRKSTG